MNRFEALKIFCTLAETLHFKETAKQLAVSPQVVTRTINDLESTLGEVLFQRSTRQVKLTEFGKQFLPQAKQMLVDMDALFTSNHQAQDERIAGLVRVAVPNIPLMYEVLNELWDRLADFSDLTLDWRADIGLVDIVDTQIDVGVRFGTPEDRRLIIRKVGVDSDCIVASPNLLGKIGTPKDWQSLQKHYPLSCLFNPNTGRVWQWYLSSQYSFEPSKPKFISQNMVDELITALKGQTIACLSRRMCQPYLQSDELVELFADLPRKEWTAYVYRPQRNVTPPRVKFVFDALVNILQQRLS